MRLDEAGRLVIPPLAAEDVPTEAKALREELSGMLLFVPIASLLIELDARTGFLACFTHAGGRKSTQSVELKRNILAVLIAGATNLGLTRMSEACGVSYDTLAWTQEWYVREETLREANTVLVNHHYTLERAGKFGGGTMSSSDGQRFPVRGKSLTGRDMVIHGGRVLLKASDVGLEFLTGELKGSHDPSGIVFTVLAAMSGMEREYIRDRTLEGHESARKRGKTIGGAGVTDDDMLSMALHLRDQEMRLRGIAKRLVITTGTKKGQHPSPATVMRMLREHDEQAATAANA